MPPRSWELSLPDFIRLIRGPCEFPTAQSTLLPILWRVFGDIKGKVGWIRPRNLPSPPAIVVEFCQCFANMCQSMECDRRSRRDGANQARQSSISLSHQAQQNGFLYARSERYQSCKETKQIFRPSTQYSTLLGSIAPPCTADGTISSFLACFRFNLEDRR